MKLVRSKLGVMIEMILVNLGLQMETAMKSNGSNGCLTTVRSPVDIVSDDFVIILSCLIFDLF